jgi:two-component system, response regulator
MRNKTILLVEDNENDVILTIRALKKNHILNDVVVANDGVEALEYLMATGKHTGRDLGEMPVVTLLDLKMPRMDGFEVLKLMRTNELTKVLPVVVLTASKEDTDIITSYKLGCNAYIRKPVDFKEFAEAIRQLGLFWLLLNEPPPQING